MAQIVLLPHYPAANVSGGFNKLSALPDQWRPDIKALQPRCFPTPFAVAEATAYQLERAQPGETESYQHRFNALVMGFVLGHLRLELWNLPTEGGLLGSALSIIEPDSKYLGVLVDAQNANVLYGAADRHALFWPGARVTKAQWDQMYQRITGDSQQMRGYELLADFREILRSSRRWDPDEVPWMRGLDALIGQNQPSPSQRTLHEDSQFFGPLKLATGDPTSKALESVERVYLPSLRIGHARTIREMSALSFRAIPERSMVVAVDAGSRELFQITVPNVPAGSDMLFLGAGTIRRTENISVGGGPGKIDLQKPDGLLAAMSPIFQSIGTMDDGMPSNERIQALPVFYPDVLRIPARLVRPSSVSYSASVERLVQQGVSLPDPATLGDGAALLPVTTPAGEQKQAVYLEKFAEHDIGDLRSIGYLLWLYFDGQAELHNGQGPLRSSANLDALSTAAEDRPFAPAASVTESVTDPRFQQDVRTQIAKRLATFQRFVASYRQSDVGSPGGLLARRSVEALSAWVFDLRGADGRSVPLPLLGSRSTRTVALSLGGDLKLPLYLDKYREVS